LCGILLSSCKEISPPVPLFLHPTLAIAGAALVGVPILIHILMRRRRKPVAWGAMRFVIEAYRRQQRRLRFEQWLLLAARCLLVLIIGAALARPMLGGGGVLGPRGPRTIYLVIDNSLASAARVGPGSELENHKEEARKVLATLDATRGDRVAIVALGSPAESIVLPPTQDLGAARIAIDGLAPTDSPADLAGAFDAVRSDLSRDGGQSGARVITLSSWRTGTFDARRTSGAATPSSRLQTLVSVPSSAAADNVMIADAAPLRSVIIGARESRAASEAVRVTLRRSGPGVGREGVARLRLAFVSRTVTGQAAIATARFEPGQQTTEVSASVDVPALADDSFGLTLVATIDSTEANQGNVIAGDDVLRHPVPARSRLRVGLIAPTGKAPRTAAEFEGADWLTLALAPAGADAPAADLRLSRIDPRSLNAAEVLAQDAILIPRPDALDDAAWILCRKAADAGALVLITPPSGDGAQLWTDTMSAGLGVNWKVGRDARSLATPLGLAAIDAKPGTNTGVLSLLAGELADLSKPVLVSRVLDVQTDDADVAMRLTDGSPLLIISRLTGAEAQPSRGLVALLCAAPDLSWTTLPAMPLMVPLMQELVRQGVGQAAGRTSTVAGAALEPLSGVIELIRLDEAAGGSDVSGPRERLAPGGTPRFASLYRAVDAAGVTRSLLAVNPDPQAGRTDTQGRNDVQTALASLGVDASWVGQGAAPAGGPREPAAPVSLSDALSDTSGEPGTSWHVPALIAALLLVLGELALARLASHARTLKPSSASLGPATAAMAPRTGDAA
jgi:hypothetical protein